jgi:sugar phosphate isomerase/epimerase
MPKTFSLAHLTVLGCRPAEATHIASDLGFDYVGFRTIPLGLPGEPRYVISEDKPMLQETKRALADTGMKALDIEIARITDGLDVTTYVPAFAAAAELGVKHVLTSSGAKDYGFTVDAVAKLCEIAAQYGLTIDFEFIAFSEIPTLSKTMALLRDVNQPNAGVLIDTLHMCLSNTPTEELDAVPRDMLRYAQLNDCRPTSVTPSTAEMIHIAREERLYLGEGVIPVRAIVDRLPDVPLALEITHKRRLEALGYREYARQCLATAKAYFGEA